MSTQWSLDGVLVMWRSFLVFFDGRRPSGRWKKAAKFKNTEFYVPFTKGDSSALRSIVLFFFAVDCFYPQKHQRRS